MTFTLHNEWRLFSSVEHQGFLKNLGFCLYLSIGVLYSCIIILRTYLQFHIFLFGNLISVAHDLMHYFDTLSPLASLQHYVSVSPPRAIQFSCPENAEDSMLDLGLGVLVVQLYVNELVIHAFFAIISYSLCFFVLLD